MSSSSGSLCRPLGFHLPHGSAPTGSLTELLWLSFSKSLFPSLWGIPHELCTSANYQYFSLDCSLVSKTYCSLVNHQNNNKNNNILTQNKPSKCFEGCGKCRVAFACHRSLLKTKKWLIQMKVLGVGTELEIIMTGLGDRRSISHFLLLYPFSYFLLLLRVYVFCFRSTPPTNS